MIGLAAAGTAAALLGWGGWHAQTHANVHVSINDVALKSPQRLWAEIASGDVVLRDRGGRALAHGRVTSPYGIVEFTDAAAGDCGRFERQVPYDSQARASWRTCFESASRWQAGWAGDVASASVTVGACRIDGVPVETGRSDDWWLWWVPLPHGGGTPMASYSLRLFIDSATCRSLNSAP